MLGGSRGGEAHHARSLAPVARHHRRVARHRQLRLHSEAPSVTLLASSSQRARGQESAGSALAGGTSSGKTPKGLCIKTASASVSSAEYLPNAGTLKSRRCANAQTGDAEEGAAARARLRERALVGAVHQCLPDMTWRVSTCEEGAPAVQHFGEVEQPQLHDVHEGRRALLLLRRLHRRHARVVEDVQPRGPQPSLRRAVQRDDERVRRHLIA